MNVHTTQGSFFLGAITLFDCLVGDPNNNG